MKGVFNKEGSLFLVDENNLGRATMKRLILVRHAKSSWKDHTLSDFDRPLNNRGKSDAPEMGNRLKKANVKPDLIISSPAKRAIKTARIIASEIGYPEKEIKQDKSIYEGYPEEIMEVIQRVHDSIDSVMVFGHNPSFTMLANHLSNQRVENLPTCAVFCLDFDIPSWKKVGEGNGKLVFFEFPKKAS